MPRLAADIYAAHQAQVLRLAAKEGGVSRAGIAKACNVSKTIANNLIKRNSLELDHKDGRTEFFKTSNGASPETPETPETSVAPELPEAVKGVGVAGDDIIDEVEEDEIAQLDAEIVDTRNALKEAAARAGKALGDWATNQSLVDALRERMTNLAVRRMNACS